MIMIIVITQIILLLLMIICSNLLDWPQPAPIAPTAEAGGLKLANQSQDFGEKRYRYVGCVVGDFAPLR